MTTLEMTRRFSRRIDKVWLTIIAGFALLSVVMPGQTEKSVLFVIAAVLDIAPYLLLAIGLAAYAGASGADNLIGIAFTGHSGRSILIAAAIGALSPFCSCGVIPLIAALLSAGVPLAPVMAFWLASPLMDPTMFMVTVGELGITFAIAKALTAFSVGLLGGAGIMMLKGTPLLSNPLKPGIGNGGCGGSLIRNPHEVKWRFWTEGERRDRFGRDCVKNALFLLKWLTLAYFLESLMLAYLPPDWIATTVGGSDIVSILIAAAVGIPAYLNGYAAIPLVSGLVQSGMAPGAGMAFLIAGGVTSIPAAIAVFALVRLPVFGLYLAFALTGAIASGIAYQTYIGG